ncbi:MAG: hypothetical protein M1269_01475 [Chloroflexi bacterium]|nr:hypothetical protein [Chloroflexota bacterium]
MAHLKNGFTILLLVVLISTLFSQPVHAAKIYDNADDVIKAFYAVKGDISNFQSNIYFARKSSDFLGEVFGAGDLDSIENGTMNYVRPDLYQVILNESGGNKIKFMSADGLNYYAVRVDFEGKPVSIGASTAAAENKKIETVSFRDSPLAFMFPYRSFTIMPGEKFEFMGNETVYSNPCYVIHVNSPFRGEHTIWISHTGLYVMRIDWTDPKDGKIVRALYRDFIPVKEQKFWLYTYMDVTREGKPLYYVEVTGQAANVPREQLEASNTPPPRAYQCAAAQAPVRD